MTKQVAATLTSVLDHPQVQVIQDRAQDVIPIAEDLIQQWNLDLYTRKPGPALNAHGEFQGTDLDLATFMFALANRGAVIQLPVYKTMRAATKREGERVSSKHDRHGQVTGLFSNQEVFSFGVRINDYNVINTDKTGKETVGAPRNFALVDITGKWHEGWQCIEFVPTAKENDFLTKSKVWTGNSVIVKNFVHPNRWISLYGQPYFITKACIDRLEEESKFLNKEIKRLKEEEGITLPDEEIREYGKTEKVGEEDKVTVRAFEVEVDLPERDGEYPRLDASVDALKAAVIRRRHIVYNLLQKLRFATRSVEYAFYLNSLKAKSTKDIEDKVSNDLNANMPGWIKAKWEQGYQAKGKRTKWNRLVLFQPAVGELGVSLRFRTWEKTERIAAEV